MTEAAAPPKRRALPFKRTVARRQQSEPTEEPKRFDEDNDLDLFRHSKDMFSEVLREAEEEDQDQHDSKKRKVGSDDEDEPRVTCKQSITLDGDYPTKEIVTAHDPDALQNPTDAWLKNNTRNTRLKTKRVQTPRRLSHFPRHPPDEFSEWISRARALQSSTNTQTIIRILVTSQLLAPPPPSWLSAVSTKPCNCSSTFGSRQPAPGVDIPDDIAAALFLTWKGNKIYGHSTLASLGVQVDEETGGWGGDGEEEVQAVQAQRKRGIKVVLKAREHEPLKMMAKEETNVAMMVEAFRGQKGVGPEWDVSIHFDGERLDDESLVTELDIDPDEVNQFEVHVKKRA
ncbi:hypothetical protein N0V88_003219 [Collariella sp. IMI 366227]|nr:hypothetical protein N0V88_003219 [Collariella sp. IMI 366227]